MPNKLHKLNNIEFIQEAGFIRAEAIKHGLNNHSFKAFTEQGIYFVRLNATISGVDRCREALILDHIAPLLITPKVIINNLEDNYLITEWSTGKLWQRDDFKKLRLVTALKKQLSIFHAINYTDTEGQAGSRLDQRLLSYAINQNPTITARLKTHINKLQDLDFWAMNNYLTHFDLNPRNIIGRKPPLLLDWEFAGQGHPLIDWLIIEHECAVDLSTHYQALDENNWLPSLRVLIQIMMQIWSK